jgi:single-stranded-DNA-specific exonuclease
MRRPKPEIRLRLSDDNVAALAREAGWSPPAAAVIAGRMGGGEHPQAALRGLAPRLAELDHPHGLADMEKAAPRLAGAVMSGETIGLETDHDVDGCTAHAVLLTALRRFGVTAVNIRSYIGHRLDEGYGLSQPLAERILADERRPNVLITADNGSGDEPRIALLADAGIDVIVTDHHDLPEAGPPASAQSCVTPRRADGRYPDTAIAGCLVAWLLACALRQALKAQGHSIGVEHSLGDLLDYVALGTVVDCVSLGASRNNRAVVRAGLARIAAGVRPCWQSALERGWMKDPVGAGSLAFGLGPRLNARGRLDDAMAGVHWLMAGTQREASRWAALLDEENARRKTIEKRLKDDAFVIASEQYAEGRNTLVVWLENGHSGVQGIVASRLVEAFGRPSVCLSPKRGRDGFAAGSARGIDGVHIRAALQACEDARPGLFEAFGGHPAAAGITLKKEYIKSFSTTFEESITAQLAGREPAPFIVTDGLIEPHYLDLALGRELTRLEPFGRGFPLPLFESDMSVTDAQPMGDGSHWRIMLSAGDREIRAAWFFATPPGEQPAPVRAGERCHVVFSVELSAFRGEERLEVHIKHCMPL